MTPNKTKPETFYCILCGEPCEEDIKLDGFESGGKLYKGLHADCRIKIADGLKQYQAMKPKEKSDGINTKI